MPLGVKEIERVGRVLHEGEPRRRMVHEHGTRTLRTQPTKVENEHSIDENPHVVVPDEGEHFPSSISELEMHLGREMEVVFAPVVVETCGMIWSAKRVGSIAFATSFGQLDPRFFSA